MAEVVVRYFASARAASGIAEEPCEAATVAELVSVLGERHGPQLSAILDASTLLVNGVCVREPNHALPSAAEVEVLPPFAGG